MSTSPGCKRLGDRRIVTRTPGYILRVEPSELDRSRFERLVAEARSVEPERAARLLREALALWRGAPLADLAYEPSHRRRSRGSRSCAWQHSSAASMPTLPAVATASWRRSSRRSHRTVGVQLGPAPWSLHRRRPASTERWNRPKPRSSGCDFRSCGELSGFPRFRGFGIAGAGFEPATFGL
jgi:hypothetical protein